MFGFSRDFDEAAKWLTKPFLIDGFQFVDRGFVHILDDLTLGIILKEMDTTKDFLEYLTQKERFISDGHLAFYAGEEELLAYYMSSFDGRAFSFVSQERLLCLGEGLWNQFKRSELYRNVKARYRPSYTWDAMIEHFASVVLSGEMLNWGPGDGSVALHESRLRHLAKLNRFERTQVSLAFAELIQQSKIISAREPDRIFVRSIQPSSGDTLYILVIFPDSGFESYQSYRQARSFCLESYCFVSKLQNPTMSHVIGISMDVPRGQQTTSEEIIHIGEEDWTPEAENFAKTVQADIGILSKVNAHFGTFASKAKYQTKKERNEAKRARRRRNH